MDTEQLLPRPFHYLALYATALIAVFAVASWTNGYPLTALFAGLFALMAAAHHIIRRRASASPANWLIRGATLLLLLVTWVTLAGRADPMATWLFILPLLAFVAWPLPTALAITLAFVTLALIMAPEGHLGPVRHHLIPMLLLSTALTGLFVFLREYKSAQLAPLRRTDALTLASSHDRLHSDLHKEIQRSEREGTALAVVEIALDEPKHRAPSLPTPDRTALIHRLGRMLHQNLRDFDSYYRIDDAAFFLILPVTETPGAASIAETLRGQARTLMESQQLKLTISAGVAGLNVGDDVDSLKAKTEAALKSAQDHGGNRVQSFTGKDGNDND